MSEGVRKCKSEPCTIVSCCLIEKAAQVESQVQTALKGVQGKVGQLPGPESQASSLKASPASLLRVFPEV